LRLEWKTQADASVPSSVTAEEAAQSALVGKSDKQFEKGKPPGPMVGASPAAANSAGEGKPSPAVPVENDPSLSNLVERTQREVRAVYTDWANTAARGDWQKHMSFYADRIEYFSYGSLQRAKVEERKRGIFRSFDSSTLRFSDSPKIHMKSSNGEVREADVTFDREWVLRRKGRKLSEGKARGMITLRRSPRGWLIVSERQMKK
jgi:ketosteroid isomerase-like protein